MGKFEDRGVFRAILAEAREGLTPGEIAAKLNMKKVNVGVAISHMRKQGKLPPLQKQKLENYNQHQIRELSAGMANIDILDENDIARLYTVIAKHGPDAVKVSAANALRDMQNSKGDSFGPPQPTDQSTEVQRLLAILDACPTVSVREAVEQWKQHQVEMEAMNAAAEITASAIAPIESFIPPAS